jgi:branched-chain amino acid transport system ATP-binding protein
MALIGIEGLQKTFGTIVALDGVDMTVGEDMILTIIGPNGAGKTTLFNCITGYYRPDSGTVWFRGTDITGEPEHRVAKRGIRRTFQDVSVFEELTVAESIDIATRSSDPEEILASLKLESVADKKGDELTLFERKRVAVGLALDGGVVLIDELFSGLNPEEKQEMIALLKDLREDKTVVLIEHDVETAFRIADEVVVLYQGSVLEQGSPEDIKASEQVRENYFGKKSI